MGRKPDRKRMAAAVVMVLAYMAYAAAGICMSRMIAAAETPEILLQKQAYVQFGAESVLCLAFLMESWYVWFQSKQMKRFAREMGYGILLTALLGVAGALAGRILVFAAAVNYFEPLLMTVEIAAVDLILAATVLRDRKRKR